MEEHLQGYPCLINMIMQMPVFIPLIDLTYKGSIGLLQKKKPLCIVVRISSLACKNSCEPRTLFYEVVKAGGLHAYLDYKGIIILSTIMPDDHIKEFKAKDYAFFINALLPDYYLTVDGWTYHKRFLESQKDLQRIMKQTKELVRLCPNSKPLGLVKGCTYGQIEMHSSWLLGLGIKDMVLHVGDFRRSGSTFHIETARNFACIIRKKARTLLLYGFGSSKNPISHSFADGYITNNHFVTTDYGMMYEGSNKVKILHSCKVDAYQKRLTEEKPVLVTACFEKYLSKNYDQILKTIHSLKYQTRLSEVNLTIWEAVTSQQEKEVLVAPVAQDQMALVTAE